MVDEIKYIILQPQQGLKSQQRAFGISQGVYNISVPAAIRPANFIANHAFAIIKNSTLNRYAIAGDFNVTLYTHPSTNLDELISYFPLLSNEIKAGLASLILSTQTFNFQSIIPPETDVYTAPELLAQHPDWPIIN